MVAGAAIVFGEGLEDGVEGDIAYIADVDEMVLDQVVFGTFIAGDGLFDIVGGCGACYIVILGIDERPLMSR